MKNNIIQKIVGNLGIDEDVMKCDRIAGNLRSMSANFETESINNKQKQYDDKRKNKQKITNAQMRRDLELTATTNGTIPFSKLGITHIPGVREELRVRGYTYDEKDSIKALVARLKTAVENKDGGSEEKSFHPQTSTIQQQFQHSIMYALTED